MRSPIAPRVVLFAVAAAAGCRAPEVGRPEVGTPVTETVLDGRVTLLAETPTPPGVQAHSERYGYPSRRVEIEPGVELFVVEFGEGVPMVFLAGGPGNSLQSFLPHFDATTVAARMILYDPRGVGRSSWTPGPEGYSTAQAIADLERLREALGVERWVVLGWSWGGLLAQHYLLAHPERVLGLVLLASSQSAGLERDGDIHADHLTAEERARIRQAYSIDGERTAPLVSDTLSPQDVRRMVYDGYRNGDWKRQFFRRPSDARMAHVAQHEWLHDRDYNPEMRATGFAEDLSGRFRESRVPVLLVYGAHDMSFSREMPARLAAEFHDAELHVLGRTSHDVFAAEPEVFFPLLDGWLARRVDRGGVD